MVSHGIADASWHSLDAPEGFIQSAQYLNFKASYSQAHTNSDIGGEMTLAHSSRLQFLSLFWHVPVEDLVSIYQMAHVNGNVCLFILYKNE
jgi:glycosylphosphatidylinositol phospholipase D